ncbi:hypothetical protein GCM10018966_062170 [Streptomyces yanii]
MPQVVTDALGDPGTDIAQLLPYVESHAGKQAQMSDILMVNHGLYVTEQFDPFKRGLGTLHAVSNYTPAP